MKNIFLASVFAALISGCATPVEREPLEIIHDLEGHTTGGRESAWKFEFGQIESLEIESQTKNIFIVRVVANAGQGRFAQRLRLTYSGSELKTVGQLSIRKL